MLGAIVALTGLAWVALLTAGALGLIPLCGGGNILRPTAPWDAAHAALLILTWTAMSVAMMLPSSTPQILGSVERQGPTTIGVVLAPVLARLVVPITVGLAAAFAEWVAQSAGLLAEPWLRVGLIVASGLLVLRTLVRSRVTPRGAQEAAAYSRDEGGICSAMACLQLGAGMNLAAMALLSVGLLCLAVLRHPQMSVRSTLH